MRLGIVLAGTGPLASPAAVEAAARAARELGYASVWSTSTDVLRTAAGVGAVPTGLLLDPHGGQVPFDGLAFLAGPAVDLRAAAACAPRPRLLETGPLPPRPGAADGWCPRLDAVPSLPAAIGSGLRLVRVPRVPTGRDLELAAWLGRMRCWYACPS